MSDVRIGDMTRTGRPPGEPVDPRRCAGCGGALIDFRTSAPVSTNDHWFHAECVPRTTCAPGFDPTLQVTTVTLDPNPRRCPACGGIAPPAARDTEDPVDPQEDPLA